MAQNYMDAMTIVKRFGKPDFFTTMTANPAWREIVANLPPGDAAQDHPDLVARVFRIKLKKLLDLLLKDHVLGRVVAFTYVVEFQKRGLPHVHLVKIVRAADKPRTPEDIDARICAEIPDKDAGQHELFDIICNSQLHGPLWCAKPELCMHGGWGLHQELSQRLHRDDDVAGGWIPCLSATI
jgi:hypothetical protein